MRATYFTAFAGVLIIVILALMLGGGSARPAAAPVRPEERQIEAVGQSSLHERASVAVLTLRVRGEAGAADEAVQVAAGTQARVVAALLAAGALEASAGAPAVEEAVGQDFTGLRRVVTYRATQSVRAVVRPAQAGPALAEALKAGASEVLPVHYGVDRLEDLKKKALAQAVASARARAEALAAEAGVTIRDVGKVTVLELTSFDSGDEIPAGEYALAGEVVVLARVRVTFTY